MKNTSIVILLLAITTLNLFGVANAKGKASDLNEKAVYAKCFVELVGGGETISFWLVKPSLLKNLARNIVGKETLLILNAQKTGNNNKATIYKAKQCVLEKDEFSKPSVKRMDENLLR